MAGFHWESGQVKNITGTGAVCAQQGALLGFYVNSTTSGTLVLRDGGSSGTAMGGTITPAIGFHRYPANFGSGGLHATIANTLDVTFFYVPLTGS
jgi:hypothetical protein